MPELMSLGYDSFEKRKQDHIELALMPENIAAECNLFDKITLCHEALPNFNFTDITINSMRFGAPVATPFIVSSMTAGHKHAATINRNLMAACEVSQWAMGVGSQRRELTDVQAAKAWLPLRRDYPKVVLFSNIGIAQLIQTDVYSINKLCDTIDAQALIIHCNALQECIQPEGTTNFSDSWLALESLVKNFNRPIIIKETGCGFSKKTLTRLNTIGIDAIDISGLGGTHWGRIEGHRATLDPLRHRAATTFRHWGINTIESLMLAKDLNPSFEIWGSGGVRHGLDAAKLMSLGATTVGFAQSLLKYALEDSEQVFQEMQIIEYELKVAMFCTGSLNLKDLKDAVCR